jgi:hypothetical protein
MRRLLPLLAFLVVAGCGGAQSGGGADEAPAPADLAADAVAALEEAGSAHYLIDASVRGNGNAFSGSLHAEGDASTDAVTAQGTVTFQGVTLSGQVLASRNQLFVNVMDHWYGDPDLGLDEADEETPSPEDVRRYFDDVFTGSVDEGLEVDGVATWRFEGKLNPEGFADLTERFDEEDLTDEQRELLRVVAENSRFALDVGKDDALPRHLEFSLELSEEDVARIGNGFDASELSGLMQFDVSATLDLSDFGKEVSYEAPANYRPLEDLFDKLFGGFE